MVQQKRGFFVWLTKVFFVFFVVSVICSAGSEAATPNAAIQGEGNNSLASAEVEVRLTPQQVVDRGAKWRIKGEGFSWRETGTKIDLSLYNNPFIEFLTPADCVPIEPKRLEAPLDGSGVLNFEFVPVPGYRIGAIPEKINVYPGETLRFRILAPYSDAAYSLSADIKIKELADWRAWGKNPQDQVDLNYFNEDVSQHKNHTTDCAYVLSNDGCFTLRIDSPDIAPFPISFKADSTNGTVIEQTVQFIPTLAAEPEPEDKGETAYLDRSGSLTVAFEPQTGYARWRIVGENVWHPGGYTLKNLEPGEADIEFSVLDHRMRQPDARHVRIFGGPKVDEKFTKLTQPLEFYPVYRDFLIPDQTVLQGDILRFQVLPPSDMKNATLAAVRTINGLTETVDLLDGWYVHTETENDLSSIGLVFTATSDTSSRDCAVKITQLSAKYPSGVRFIERERPAKIFDRESSDYIVRTSFDVNQDVLFNCETRSTRAVEISGVDIVFQKDHINGLYNSYNGNLDIERFVIYADRVIIRDRLELPQTEIKIYAREARFEGDSAALVTTPLDKADLDPNNAGQGDNQSAQYGQDGIAGMPAGDIYLYVESIVDGGNSARLICAGGKGQMAGPGRDGIDGSVMEGDQPCGRAPTGFYGPFGIWQNWPNVVQHGGDSVIAIHTRVGNSGFPQYATRWGWFGDPNRWPTDGSDAVIGGRPGVGGKGGTVFSLIPVSSTIKNEGGESGKATLHTWGGRPGGPNPAVRWTWSSGSVVGHHQRWGLNAFSPRQERVRAQNGVALPLLDEGLTWLHPNAIRQLLVYARDCYLHGQYDTTRKILESCLLPLDAYKWPDETATDFAQLQAELQSMLSQLNAGLDYFGNPEGWVPNLSLEMELAKYKGEIDHLINLFVLTRWVERQSDSVENLINGLRKSINNSLQEIEDSEKAYNKLIAEYSVSDGESDAIIRDTETLESRLAAITNRLLIEANDNARHAKILAYAKIVGSVLQCIPSPYTIAAGTALNIAADIDEGEKSVEESIAEGAMDGIKAWQSYKAKELKDKLDKENDNFAKKQESLAEDRKKIETAIAKRESEEQERKERKGLQKAEKDVAKLKKDKNAKQEDLNKANLALEKLQEQKKLKDIAREEAAADTGNATTTLGENAKNPEWLSATSYLLQNRDKTLGNRAEEYTLSSDAVPWLQLAVQTHNSIMRDIRHRSTSSKSVRAELDRLTSGDAEFQKTNNELLNLLKHKEQLAGRLNQLSTRANQLLNNISANALDIDKFYRAIASNSTLNHLEVKQAIQGIERRAMDRLLKYHYTLAKAYEFRILKPYEGDFRLERLVKETDRLLSSNLKDAAATEGWKLTPESYGVLAAIFEEPIKDMAGNILDEMENKWHKLESQGLYTLHSNEVKKLRETGEVTIDLSARGIFPKDGENVGLRTIGAYQLFVLTSGDAQTDTVLRIDFVHDGISRLQKDGKTYQFQHYTDNRGFLPVWASEARLRNPNGHQWNIKQARSATTDNSVLAALLGREIGGQDRFILPGAASPITLKFTTSGGVPKDFDKYLESLTFYFDYEYRQKTDVQKTKLDVLVQGDEYAAELEAPIQITPEDLNGDSLGMGYFSRTYNKGTQVVLSAVDSYGDWTFSHWITPSGERDRNKILTARLDDSKWYRAIYEYESADTTTPKKPDYPNRVELVTPDIPRIIVEVQR
ncbi:hypothetical protein AGMMS50276_05480 [Synergistales bacterium]|nr:hypothetical protein AGMMS50276_05480 [Synergistales bacterium]